ncbi:hypothetical protein M407DRAFT_240532 [Tulasnella calospora MUT 4182]|uniref:Uncharacterized protein n=1 Tax=Tulasnella calospora MUT 4182 TaxID=1051891 RepID=A0A0C3QNE3_9AGAM|nr:hypothetical protein M407DRAFT_240532 [Tulasnella calospora MUT 4182]
MVHTTGIHEKTSDPEWGEWFEELRLMCMIEKRRAAQKGMNLVARPSAWRTWFRAWKETFRLQSTSSS